MIILVPVACPDVAWASAANPGLAVYKILACSEVPWETFIHRRRVSPDQLWGIDEALLAVRGLR